MMTSLLPSPARGELIIREGEKQGGGAHKEIKKSKSMSKVSAGAMNHGDIPGWVSEAAAAVWSWMHSRPLKGRLFKH